MSSVPLEYFIKLYVTSIMFYLIFAITLFLVLYYYTKNKKLQILHKVPISGVLLEIILDCHQFYENISRILEKSKGTFLFRASWLAERDILFTSDPANVHCIMVDKFSRFEKGIEWRKRFDFVGYNNTFNSDFEEWKHHRKVTRYFVGHRLFHKLFTITVSEIIEKGLIPVLDHASEQDIILDLQDLVSRFTFDLGNVIATGNNPNSLSVGLPENPMLKALEDAWEVTAFRYVVPERIWKLQRWLGIGKERKLSEARKVIDDFCSEQIAMKQEEMKRETTKNERDQEDSFNLLNCFFTDPEFMTGTTPTEEVLRDNIINILLGVADTTSSALSWFLWLISKNPFAEEKIREELARNSPKKQVKKCQLFHLDDLSKLVYLHAALCETLRLFPSAPLQFRTAVQEETLPSGHRVNQKTNIILSAYAMARMTSIWGEDCREFKPERWITKEGGIKHEPAHKFFAFSAGPRICLGKDISFIGMKAIAATIIHNYQVQVLENHPVTPTLSTFLRMEPGLMAKIKTR